MDPIVKCDAFLFSQPVVIVRICISVFQNTYFHISTIIGDYMEMGSKVHFGIFNLVIHSLSYSVNIDTPVYRFNMILDFPRLRIERKWLIYCGIVRLYWITFIDPLSVLNMQRISHTIPVITYLIMINEWTGIFRNNGNHPIIQDFTFFIA